ncbi:hypothetical protein V2J09_021130 [Rumex salicifolius]
MASKLILILLFLTTQEAISAPLSSKSELRALLELKSSLDPSNARLISWSTAGDPCEFGSFEGVGCNEDGQVANISLQGKGLQGQLSSAIGDLPYLTGLYLHYNSLHGEIPLQISQLTLLADLYLNVNNFSGQIPSQIGNMDSLQVLQLCYNQLTGNIPTQLGSLKKLSVVALQFNHLSGAIPASLGELKRLVRLDLSFNALFGSIPSRLADAPLLEALDIQNNSLSGTVPPALKRLDEGFQFANNRGLCGVGFMSLAACSSTDRQGRPLPEGAATLPVGDIPETANVISGCTNPPHCSSDYIPKKKKLSASVAISVLIAVIAVSAIVAMSFSHYRRRKQRLGSSFDMSDNRLSTDLMPMESCRKAGSPLISVEYPGGWDPLAHHEGGGHGGGFSQELLQSFMFNLEEIESATQHFSPSNLLGKSNFSAVYRGRLRDGSLVAVRRISKSSCRSEEAEFLKGLNTLTSIRHENLVRLRGFCCSRGRGECFLVYDLVPNGNLLRYLDLKDGDAKVLEWSVRVSIIKGIAKGIHYLHSYKVNKPPLVHENVSAEKVLVDNKSNPQLSDSGLNKLLTNDTVFSTLKSSAAMGYLAPEYTTTGKLTEKSDVYAFGILVLQILSGGSKINLQLIRAAEASNIHQLMDPNLHGRFSEAEAAKIARIATACSLELPLERPSMEAVSLELGCFGSGGISAFVSP